MQVDAWVHLYGSEGIVHYFSELLLSISNVLSLFGEFNISSSVQHAFVHGSLLANVSYVWHRLSDGCTIPLLGHIEAWYTGITLIHCVGLHGIVWTSITHVIVEALYTVTSMLIILGIVPTLAKRGCLLFGWKSKSEPQSSGLHSGRYSYDLDDKC